MTNIHLKNQTAKPFTDDYYLQKIASSNAPLDVKLKNNYAFRKTFKNKTILKGFLMALLNFNEEDIVDIEVADPAEEGESIREKEGILDIKVHMNNNTKLNIEMQNRYQEYWPERSIFYNCRMFTERFYRGMNYNLLEPCIHVGILNFTQMKSKGYHHQIALMDGDTKEIYSSKFLFHVIELSKLNEAENYEKQEELYHWAKLIAADRWEDICMEAKGNPYRELVQEELEKIRQDETERWLYLREEMALMDERCRLNTAMHQGLDRGRTEGLAEGLDRGRTEGLAEGLDRGRTEGLAEGLDRGRTEGHTQGLQQMQFLTQKLLQDNRIEDLKKASEDENYLQKLMEEYGIL